MEPEGRNGECVARAEEYTNRCCQIGRERVCIIVRPLDAHLRLASSWMRVRKQVELPGRLWWPEEEFLRAAEIDEDVVRNVVVGLGGGAVGSHPEGGAAGVEGEAWVWGVEGFVAGEPGAYIFFLELKI